MDILKFHSSDKVDIANREPENILLPSMCMINGFSIHVSKVHVTIETKSSSLVLDTLGDTSFVMS